MSLQSAARDRLRPWYALDVAAFLLGSIGGLRRQASGTTADLTSAVFDPYTAVVAIVYGLLAVLVLRFTVGNLWAYAVEYVNAGGQWSDLPFLVTVGGGLAAVAITYAATSDLGAAVWAGFWAFAAVAGIVALAVSFAAGYRDTAA